MTRSPRSFRWKCPGWKSYRGTNIFAESQKKIKFDLWIKSDRVISLPFGSSQSPRWKSSLSGLNLIWTRIWSFNGMNSARNGSVEYHIWLWTCSNWTSIPTPNMNYNNITGTLLSYNNGSVLKNFIENNKIRQL